jgi:death-on-curing protein
LTRYLNSIDVIALHNEILRQLGAPPAALRDAGGLESAVARPQMAAAYEDADLVRQGTLLAIGISQAQAFVDGNKRTAYASLRVFLRINGARFTGAPLELADALIRVAERTDSLSAATDRFESWLRGHVATAPNRQ